MTHSDTHTIDEISGKDLKLVKTINLTNTNTNTKIHAPKTKHIKPRSNYLEKVKEKKETINPNGSKTTNICLKHIVT